MTWHTLPEPARMAKVDRALGRVQPSSRVWDALSRVTRDDVGAALAFAVIAVGLVLA